MEDDGPSQLTPPEPSREALVGYFLFAVGWELAGKGRRPHQVKARVYVKAGFPLDGVRKTLECAGERVLLRDIQREAEEAGGEAYWSPYSMDTCSLVFPINTGSLDPTMVRYIYSHLYATHTSNSIYEQYVHG